MLESSKEKLCSTCSQLLENMYLLTFSFPPLSCLFILETIYCEKSTGVNTIND